jgi:hypothetical protein
MRRFIILTCAPLAFFLTDKTIRADGYCPWFNIIDARHNNYPKELARINGFWQGYYGSMQNFYGNLSHLDWVAYYKNYGTPIGCVQGACGGPRYVQMAPVFIGPTFQWGIPGTVLEPPAAAPAPPTIVPPTAPMFYPQ